MEDAAQYSTREDWKDGPGGGYMRALGSGWLDQCCAHMPSLRKPNGHWTLERCIADAKRHGSKRQWSAASSGAFTIAHREGWLDQCCEHMTSNRKPHGYWTLERCMEDASRFSGRAEWKRESSSAFTAARKKGWLDQCCEHMGRAGGTANDVVYIWRNAGSDLHKVGVTSARIGEGRIAICRRHNGMDPRIVLMLKVADARAVESKLLELGTDPELDSSIDGYTEFRRLTDAQLGQAVSIAYEAALAA